MKSKVLGTQSKLPSRSNRTSFIIGAGRLVDPFGDMNYSHNRTTGPFLVTFRSDMKAIDSDFRVALHKFQVTKGLNPNRSRFAEVAAEAVIKALKSKRLELRGTITTREQKQANEVETPEVIEE